MPVEKRDRIVRSTRDLGTAFDFPAGSFRTPGTFLFWGARRLPLNRLILVLARRVDPGFLWLELASRDDPSDPQEPSVTGEIGPSRLVRIEPEAGSVHPVSAPSVESLVRDDAGSSVRAALHGFLRLPEPVQELIGRVRPGRGPRVLAIASIDRILRNRPDEPGGLRSPLSALKASGVTVVATASVEPRRDRVDFDNVYRVGGAPGAPWQDSWLEAEQGALSDRRLGRVPVRTIAPFAEEFSATQPGVPPGTPGRKWLVPDLKDP